MSHRPTALVTGGRRGIGRGIALALAQRGFNVAINDVALDADAEETLAALRATGVRAEFLEADIADVSGHAALVSQAWDVFGAVECLVNNAGVQVARRRDILDDTPEDFDRVMGVNIRAGYFLTIAMASRMIAAPATDKPRAIVNVASVNSAMVSPNRGSYCVSKAAVSMMTQLFALRLAPHGIMVNEVRPGIIQTPMTAGVADSYGRLIADGIAPVRRWGMPADIGAAVALLASGELPFVTGEAIHVDGGLHIQDF
jgi:NAD(P)-dependent dehydrogenase (short-subunit alcohol dehydrogenase family)